MLTWLVCPIAAFLMLAAIAAAILAGLALRFVAAFLRGIGDGREGAVPRKVGKIEAHRRRQAGRG